MDKLGDEEFLALEGPPDLVKSRLELVARAGVNGTGFFDLGARGQPFTVRSRCDYANYAAAVDAFSRYCGLIDADPLALTLGDVELSGYGVVFQVLDVRAADLRAIVGGSGGLNPPSQGWLEAEWTLVPVPVPEEE